MKKQQQLRVLWVGLVCALMHVSLTAGDWIQQSIDLTINARFDSAESVVRPHFNHPQERLPAYFYWASILNSRMAHFENYEQAGLFLAALDSVLKYSERQLSRAPLSKKSKAQLLFYRGSALGYKAFYEGRTGRWFSALNDGMASVADLQQAVQLDSALYEAYLGIGVYQYWRSTKLKYLLWTPFVSDLREQGIANIKKAVRLSRRSRYMAMHQLIYILVNYRHFDEAWQYAQQARAAFPESPFMHWAYAHTLFMMHKNQQAANAFQTLLKLIRRQGRVNPAHVLTCHVRLAEIYSRLGQPAKCHRQLKEAFAIDEKKLSATGQKELAKARLLWQNCLADNTKTGIGAR